ncbi:hypothetical protein PI87_26685 [Ralstonia sp. A12]|uniref:hypothetical protein n=1 Tax=Ralstonia sp. A12 TaxID=1217052 RepID=UPI0005745925|nr:hypothetical protein [Ralstonia sp. A12]KHK49184.1 hypothetical protein PI87_26685 [Ralstonia sp. A12]
MRTNTGCFRTAGLFSLACCIVFAGLVPGQAGAGEYLDAFNRVDGQTREIFCNWALFAKAGSFTREGSEHRGLSQQKAEQAWDEQDHMLAKAFAYDQLARMVGLASYDKASKVVYDTFMASAAGDKRKAFDTDEALIQVHCLKQYGALEEIGAPVKKLEAIYFDMDRKGREHAKADYVEQAVKPYRD